MDRWTGTDRIAMAKMHHAVAAVAHKNRPHTTCKKTGKNCKLDKLKLDY